MSRDYPPPSKRLEAINNSYSIMHYGVKGMKWGKKKKAAGSALDSARKAKLEAQTMRSIIDRDTTYTVEGKPSTMNAALQAVTDANKAVMFYNGSDEQTAGMDYATLLKARKYAKEQHEIAKKNLTELTNKLQSAEAQKKREKDFKLNRMK